MLMFSLYDSKAQGFLQPMFQKTRGMAVRAITRALTESSELQQFAADYTLFELGEFHEDSGEFVPDRHNLGQLSQYQEAR